MNENTEYFYLEIKKNFDEVVFFSWREGGWAGQDRVYWFVFQYFISKLSV